MYDHIFYKQVQISRSDIRPHIKWAVSLVILHMVTSISLQGLCGYIWVNILTLSPQRVNFERKETFHFYIVNPLNVASRKFLHFYNINDLALVIWPKPKFTLISFWFTIMRDQTIVLKYGGIRNNYLSHEYPLK